MEKESALCEVLKIEAQEAYNTRTLHIDTVVEDKEQRDTLVRAARASRLVELALIEMNLLVVVDGSALRKNFTDDAWSKLKAAHNGLMEIRDLIEDGADFCELAMLYDDRETTVDTAS